MPNDPMEVSKSVNLWNFEGKNVLCGAFKEKPLYLTLSLSQSVMRCFTLSPGGWACKVCDYNSLPGDWKFDDKTHSYLPETSLPPPNPKS